VEKKMFKIIITLLIILLLPVYVFAGYNKPGGTIGQFMAVGISARATGLGEAIIANVNDISAIYYNPGAMINIKNWDALFTHTWYPADVSMAFMGLGRHISQNQVVALSITSLYTDEMVVRTTLQPEGTGETFYCVNYMAALGFSSYLTDRFSFGINAKLIHLGYWSGKFNSNSWGIDVGALFRSGIQGLNIGVTINNLGPDIEVINESYNIPTSFNAGISADILKSDYHNLSVMTSWNKPESGEEKAALGFEYDFKKFLFARSGYKFNHDTESWSFGIGMIQSINKVKITADYSYSDFNVLPDIQRISIGFIF
jgi:hypothetical protein